MGAYDQVGVYGQEDVYDEDGAYEIKLRNLLTTFSILSRLDKLAFKGTNFTFPMGKNGAQAV